MLTASQVPVPSAFQGDGESRVTAKYLIAHIQIIQTVKIYIVLQPKLHHTRAAAVVATIVTVVADHVLASNVHPCYL